MFIAIYNYTVFQKTGTLFDFAIALSTASQFA